MQSNDSSKPNIVLISADEHRFDAVGCNGNPHIKTPNLDQLAREGISFLNHTCSAPICTPARVSILTGQYPRTHGALSVGFSLDTSARGLAHWLADNGYRCGMFGKSHFEPEQSDFAVNMDHSKPYYGFTHFHITEDNPAGDYLDWVRMEHPDQLEGVMKTVHEDMQAQPIPMKESGHFKAVYTSPVPENLHQTTWITDKTIDFINDCRTAGKPFFTWCSFVDPHHPWIPPEPFASLYDPETLPLPEIREGENEGLNPGYNYPDNMPASEYKRMCAAYYAMISHIDYHTGRIISALKEKGLYENTMIIYTSDHGDYNGDHGLIRKNPWLFDNVMRVPMIVRNPESPAPGTRHEGITQHEDIAPTILEKLCLPVSESIQGVSFFNVLESNGKGDRKYAYYDLMGKTGVQKDNYKLLYYPKHTWPESRLNTGSTDGDSFRLLEYPDKTGGFILTDVSEDPLEYDNLCGKPEYVSIENELKTELFRWLRDTKIYYPAKKYAW